MKSGISGSLTFNHRNDYQESGRGAGSDMPGCVDEWEYRASIDSSMPRSTLASVPGCFFTLSSSSRSGAPDSVGAGGFPFLFLIRFVVRHEGTFQFRFHLQNECLGRAFPYLFDR